MIHSPDVACFKVIAIFFACLFGRPALQAQVFWSETFADESAAYNNWLAGGANAGPEEWTWTNDPSAGYKDPDLPVFSAPSATDGYFYFDSDKNGTAAFDVTLTNTMAPIDCSGKTDVHLRFFSQYIYFNPAGTVAEIGVSTDGVNFTYHPLFSSLPANYAFNNWVEADLDEADGQAKVWLQFRWTGTYEYHWKVDDLTLYVPCSANPGAIICDDFDAYDPALKLGPQSNHWTTRSGIEDTDEDGIVTTEQASTALNALKIAGTAPSGGPENVVLELGNRSSGRYELDWRLYVPAGKKGYFNLLDTLPGSPANLHVYFDAAGMGRVRDTPAGADVAEFSYPYDQWFDIQHIIDLDHRLLTLYINGAFIFKRSYSGRIGGANFYGNDNQHLYYLDDVVFAALPSIAFNPDSCEAAVDLSQYFGHTPNAPQITGLFDNTNATASPTDPPVSCWNEAGNNGLDILNNTMWFTFTGDGETYDIQTVPCNAANYIGTAQGDKGDTQMLVYEGDNCTDLTPVQCNDDLFSNGMPDWRAGVTLDTKAGQNYYMLIDGFENQGIVATGEFCIQITLQPSTACAEGQVGAFALANNGYLCVKENLLDILTADAASFVLPTVGQQHGLAWCFSQSPVPQGAWPGKIPNIASTPFTPDLSLPFLLNNDTTLAFGTWYLTPVVLGGGVLINAGMLPYVFNVDPADGCYFVGASQKLTLLPALADLSASYQTVQETLPPGANGSITLTVSGGAAQYLNDLSLYRYKWNNNSTTKDISGLSAGNYTVTISDGSDCVAPLVLSIPVDKVTDAAADPAFVRAFTLRPNPAADAVTLHLTLEQAAAVRVDVVSLHGQVLLTRQAGAARTLDLPLDLSDFASGAYLVRVEADGQVAWRRLAVQR